MTDECKAIIEFLNCETELFENEKSGDKIVNRWDELSQQGKQAGFYPLIIVASDTLAETLELIFDDNDIENTPEAIVGYRKMVIEEAEKIDVSSFFAERLAEYTEMHEGDDILGKFKDAQPDEYFYSHMDGDTPYPEIIIAKIPATNPWELAAWIPMGGFNDCPYPAQQIAVFKYWYEKYGAVSGVVTYDVWEMELTKPPLADEAAELLAKEHFTFCYDAIMQAASEWDTIRASASAIKGSTTWYFWWD